MYTGKCVWIMCKHYTISSHYKRFINPPLRTWVLGAGCMSPRTRGCDRAQVTWPGSLGPPVRTDPQWKRQRPLRSADDIWYHSRGNRTEQVEQLPQPSNDSKYLGEWRPKVNQSANAASSLNWQDRQHFGTTETTWAKPMKHVPHWDHGSILGDHSPSQGTGAAGRLGMASPLYLFPSPHKQEGEIENLKTMITPTFP